VYVLVTKRTTYIRYVVSTSSPPPNKYLERNPNKPFFSEKKIDDDGLICGKDEH
jgi:hypothetical protein